MPEAEVITADQVSLNVSVLGFRIQRGLGSHFSFFEVNAMRHRPCRYSFPQLSPAVSCSNFHQLPQVLPLSNKPPPCHKPACSLP